MTMLEAWAKRYGLSITDAKRIARLIRCRAREQTHYCNGDPHHTVADPSDKNACATAWAKESDRTDAVLTSVAAEFGFSVDYGVGLYPALMRDGDTCIMVPV
ncbi:MAG TPA: hypothetical protein VNU68_22510 [Verrucomicrobiae bacterium]|nr:hypothetical protein [Verrucomicrobiae bacterium]